MQTCMLIWMISPKGQNQKMERKWHSLPYSYSFLLSGLKTLFFFFVSLSLSDPHRGWKWRIKTRAWENKPSCNQVGEHRSPPITTLLDKSLFSQHTVSTWCYQFSLNSIKSLRSDENCIVLRWAQSCASSPYEAAYCNMTCWGCTAARSCYEHRSLLNLGLCFDFH